MDSVQKNYLAETARWQKLLGVVMMVCTVLIALLGILFIVGGSALGSALDDLEDAALFGGIGGAAAGIVYLLMALLYYFFAHYLLQSAKYLKAYVASDDEADLTEGLKNNKSYFKLNGILTIIALILVALAVVVGVIVGLAGLA